MKKILFFIPTLGGGGAEKVLVNLVNNLDSKKYDITVQTLFDIGINKKSLKDNIKYKTIFRKRIRGNIHILKLFSRKFLFKMMIKEKYDIIVSYLEGPTTRIVSGCTDLNTKLINWVHTEMKNIKEFQKSYRNKKEMKIAYNRYDATVFVAEIAKTNFEKITKFNLKNEIVVRNVIDTNEIIEKSMEKIEDTKKQITLVTLGRLVPIKGYDRLLRIHKKLLEEGINHDLWILGEGHERRNIEEFIRKNSLQSTVKLYGYQENPYKYLREADIYVCSSYVEGYSTAIAEALIIGKPIVTTRCSGMDEILQNGKYGLITENNENDLYNGIKKMLLNQAVRNKYKELALKRREYFNINKQLESVDKIFENC